MQANSIMGLTVSKTRELRRKKHSSDAKMMKYQSAHREVRKRIKEKEEWIEQ